MILAHRIRLDPNNLQRSHFVKACGCARFAYNWGLAEWKRQYESGEKPSEFSLSRKFNSIKRDQFPFFLEVTKCVPQYAIADLGSAFRNFFDGLKSGKKTGYPKFKKKGSRDSFRIGNDDFVVKGSKIRIPKLGYVRMCEPMRFSGKILSATIRRTADRWFVSISVEMPDPKTPGHSGSTVGIDFGCANFATLSTGEKVKGPKPHKAMLKRLRRLDKSLHRKKKGSRNRKKARVRLSRLHARIANIRKDFIDKFTTDTCRRFSVIGIENLNVMGMSKNHTLARSILDGAPGKMRRQLTYKAPMHGCQLVVADRWFPSSKLCSACGAKAESMPLSVRLWTCAACGTVHDRDVNAAKNLERIAASSAVTACGVSSSGAELLAA